jgi:hypothetical protein
LLRSLQEIQPDFEEAKAYAGLWSQGKKKKKKKKARNTGLDSSSSGQRPVVGFSEHGNEPSGSIKGGEFLDNLREYELL